MLTEVEEGQATAGGGPHISIVKDERLPLADAGSKVNSTLLPTADQPLITNRRALIVRSTPDDDSRELL
jgi:hypothetical protein